MTGDIAYSVFKPADRTMWQVEWKDPKTGAVLRRSTKCTRKRDADRKAGGIVEEWLSNRGREGDDAWSDFRRVHEEEFQPSLAVETRRVYGTIFNAVEEHIAPRRMSDIDSRAISRLQSRWRADKLSEYSIRTYLSHLQKSLKWAVSQERMAQVPFIEFPKVPRKGKAKGRPLSGEEFERMLAAVPKVVKSAAAAETWVLLLHGLWLSSLRLDEALNLSWDDREAMRVDLEGEFPALLIPSYTEKGRQDRIIPIMPDFAEFLGRTPADRRSGFVFTLIGERKGRPSPRNMQYVSARISKIGKMAGIIVGHYVASGKTKYASAHDLRRSFGKRWAAKVRNAFDLKTLMRHESLETTQTFYAHEDAAELAADIAHRFTDTSTDTPQSAPENIVARSSLKTPT